MARFLLLAIVLVVGLMAVFGIVIEILGLEADLSPLGRGGFLRRGGLPIAPALGLSLLEAMGLIGLFLLIQGKGGPWWMDGLLAGWLAWIFRGPVLVLTVTAVLRLPPDPWWQLALRWWVLYSLCGLLVAWLAKRTGVRAGG